MGRLDKTQKTKHGRAAFTLIEIMIVLVIVGLLAGVVAPRIFRYEEPPAVRLRRTVEEASNHALSGISIRLKLEPVKDFGKARRGRLVAEALAKTKDPANPGRETLVWSPVKLAYPTTGEGWSLDPEVVYFHTDGSCTPARVSWTQPGTSDSDAEMFLLTVTGYLFEKNEKKRR